MPFYIVNGTPMHINLGGRKGPEPCLAEVWREGKTQPCCDISGYACDWKLANGKTCDAPLCDAHAKQTGKNRHLCPAHLAEQHSIQPPLF